MLSVIYQNIIAAIILEILGIIGFYLIFKKSGVKTYKAIIPGYNLYILFELIHGNGNYVFLLFIPFFNFLYLIYSFIKLCDVFNYPRVFAFILTLFCPIGFFILGCSRNKYRGFDYINKEFIPKKGGVKFK